MSASGSTYHARVEGDDIVFNGRKVSPRGLTLAIAGEGRNAWRDLYIRFPGERHFLPASRCRREHEQKHEQDHEQEREQEHEQEREQEREPKLGACASNATAAPVSPADSLNAAALTTAEALKTTLALMEQAMTRPMPMDDRRVMAPWREIDILADHCAFD